MAFSLINSPPLTDTLKPLSTPQSCIAVSSITIILDTVLLNSRITHLPPLKRAWNTRPTIRFHPYSVQLSNTRVTWYFQSYMFPLTATYVPSNAMRLGISNEIGFNFGLL